jgi:hypothetical protein
LGIASDLRLSVIDAPYYYIDVIDVKSFARSGF